MKKLTPEEVPTEYRHLFHFDKQSIGNTFGNKTGLKISRGCVDCARTYEVIVSQVRADFKRGRKMLGRCKMCRNDGLVTKEGYIWIYKPEHPNAYSGKYVPQHILVMEDSLGRLIDGAIESVHHINGDRADNEISNLQLRKRYHGKGQAWECQDCGSHNVVAVELADATIEETTS